MEGGIISVRVLGVTGKEGKNELQFAQPRGVCVNRETKELFVVDCNNHRIQVYHLPSLAFIRQIGRGVQSSGPGGFMYPVGICMDDANQIFIADTNNHRIVVFNHLTGTYLRSIGSHGPTPGSFNCPYGVCVDRTTGLLYTADYENNRVQVFDKDTGVVIRVIGNGGGSSAGEFNQPIDVCVDEENQNLLVADYSNNRVQIFNKLTGVFERFVGELSGPNSFSGPRSIYINKEVGLLFVSDRENHRIHMYNKNTFEFIRFIGNSVGVGLGQFNRPMELCCDNEEGVLIVVDGYNHRVQIIEIPELQVERQRIKNAKKSGENIVTSIPTQVRPSRQVVSVLSQPLNSFHRKRICNGYSLLQFDKLGEFYDNIVVLEGSESEEVGLSLDAIDIQVSAESTTDNDLCITQGTLFMKMLDDLVPIAFAAGSLILLTPTIVGMQALLQKGWLPTRISTGSISGMFGILQDDNVGNNTHEHTQVISGIVQLLRSSIHNNFEAREHIFQLLTTALKSPVAFSHTQSFSTQSSIEHTVKHILILFAYFDIFEAFLGSGHPDTATALASDGAAQNTSMVSKAKGHSTNTYTNEFSLSIMNFMMGVTLTQFALDFTKSVEASSSSSKVLTSSSPKVSAAGSVALSPTLIQMMESLVGLESSRNAISTSYASYQIARKQYLSACWQHVKQLEHSQNLLGKHREKKSRGGRNIWDGVSAFQIGDLIDCMDREKVWFESIVVDVVGDGGIKVHFMGWGAKWDDLIGAPETPLRVAVLNSKTVNWRSELFEGGLIEIKCNDDMVNQKWMWGRIMKLNLDDDWVEIAYSFSTEPLVVKKAWLYGETICPVGMHTKDKSKNAAASIVKPGKKVDQILKEKLATSSMAEEVLFYDFEDDYLDIDEVASDRGVESYFLKAKHMHGVEMSTFFTVPQMAFISLTKELVMSIGDCVSKKCSLEAFVEEELPVASDLMKTLFQATSPKLFLECIIKPIYFQAGLLAKILVSTISACSLTHAWKWDEVLQMSDQLTNLIAAYHSVLTKIFSSVLSSTTVVFINERIRSTINRCGFTPVANQIIQSCAQSPPLLVQAIQPLLSADKFHKSAIQARKFIRLIFSSASTKEVNLLLDLVEHHFIRKDCQQLLQSLSTDVSTAKKIETLLLTYDNIGSQYSKHTMEHHRLLCAVERILVQQALQLSATESRTIAMLLSSFIDRCLSKFKRGLEDDSSDTEDMPLQSLEKLITIVKMLSMNEELRHFFVQQYLFDLSVRLAHGNFMSLAVERKMVFDFDIQTGAFLLDDVTRSTRVMNKFNAHLLQVMDATNNSTSNHFYSFVRQGGVFTTLVGSKVNWRQLTKTAAVFANLPLPPLLQHARYEFEAFYSQPSIGALSAEDEEDEDALSAPATRKLYWCFGLGSIFLDCWLRNKRVASNIVVNEPQYCIIHHISNSPNNCATLADLSLALNLPLETVSQLVASLLTSSPKLLAVRDKVTLDKVHSAAVSVDASFLSAQSEFAFDEGQLREYLPYSFQLSADRATTSPLNVHFLQQQARFLEDTSVEWRGSRVDAQVLRVLKKQQVLFPHLRGYSREQLFGKVLPLLKNTFSNVIFCEQDIDESCRRLVRQGVLDRDMSTTREVFSYLLSTECKRDENVPSLSVMTSVESSLSRIISPCLTPSNESGDEQPEDDSAIGESKEESTRSLESTCDQLLLTMARLQPFPSSLTLSSQREDFPKQLSQIATGLVLFVSAVVTQLHFLIANNSKTEFVGSLDAFLQCAQSLAQRPSQRLLDCISLFIFTKLPQHVIDSILTVFVTLVDKKGIDAKINSTLQHILMHGVSIASWPQLLTLWTYSFSSKESIESKFAEVDEQTLPSHNLTLAQIFIKSISTTDPPPSKVKVAVRSFHKPSKDKDELHVVDLSTPTAKFTLNTLVQQVCKQCATYLGVQDLDKESMSSSDVDADGYSIDDLNFLVQSTFSVMAFDATNSVSDCIWWDTSSNSFQTVAQQAVRIAQEASRNSSISTCPTPLSKKAVSLDNNSLGVLLQRMSDIMNVPALDASLLLCASNWDVSNLLDSWFAQRSTDSLIARTVIYEVNLVEGKPPQLKCPACQRRCSLADMVYTSACGHGACRSCWKTHIDGYQLTAEHFPAVPCIHKSSRSTAASCDCWLGFDMLAYCLGKEDESLGKMLLQAHGMAFDKYKFLTGTEEVPLCIPKNSVDTKCRHCHHFECISVASEGHPGLHQASLFAYFHGSNQKQIEEIRLKLAALQTELRHCRRRDTLDSLLFRVQYWQQVYDCELLVDHCQKLLVLSDYSLELTQLMRWQESFLDFPKVHEPSVEELHQVRRLGAHLQVFFAQLCRNLDKTPEDNNKIESQQMLSAVHAQGHKFGDLNVSFLQSLLQTPANSLDVSKQSDFVKFHHNIQHLRQLEHCPREEMISKMKELLDALEGMNNQHTRSASRFQVNLGDVVAVAEALEYMVSDPDSFIVMLAVAKSYFEFTLHVQLDIDVHNAIAALQQAMQCLQHMLCAAIDLYDNSVLNIIYNSFKVFQYFMKLVSKIRGNNKELQVTVLGTGGNFTKVLFSKLREYQDIVEAAEEGGTLEKMEEVLESCKMVSQLVSIFANESTASGDMLELLHRALWLTMSLQAKALAVPERAWEATLVQCLQNALQISSTATRLVSTIEDMNDGELLTAFSNKVSMHFGTLFASLMKSFRKVAMQSSAKKDANHILSHDHLRRNFEQLCICIVLLMASSKSAVIAWDDSFDMFQEAIVQLLDWKWVVSSNVKPSTTLHHLELVNLITRILSSYCSQLSEESKLRLKTELIYERLRYLREDIKTLFKETTTLSRRLQYHWSQHQVDECLEAINKLRVPKPRTREIPSPSRESVRSPPPARNAAFPPTAANETQMLNILFNEVLARRRNIARAPDGENNNAVDNGQIPMRTLLGQLLDYTNAVQNITDAEQRMQQDLQATHHPMQMPMAAMMLLRRDMEEEQQQEQLLRRERLQGMATLPGQDRLRDSDDDSSDDRHSRSDSSESSSNDSEDF